MILWTWMLTLGIAFIISLLFIGPLGWRRTEEDTLWSSALFLFVLTLGFVWLAAIWVRPIGPTIAGIAWIPLIVAGLLVALVLAVATPGRPRPRGALPSTEEPPSAGALGAFFWVLALVVILALVAGYRAG